MKLAVFGLGYVGLVTALCYAADESSGMGRRYRFGQGRSIAAGHLPHRRARCDRAPAARSRGGGADSNDRRRGGGCGHRCRAHLRWHPEHGRARNRLVVRPDGDPGDRASTAGHSQAVHRDSAQHGAPWSHAPPDPARAASSGRATGRRRSAPLLHPRVPAPGKRDRRFPNAALHGRRHSRRAGTTARHRHPSAMPPGRRSLAVSELSGGGTAQACLQRLSRSQDRVRERDRLSCAASWTPIRSASWTPSLWIPSSMSPAHTCGPASRSAAHVCRRTCGPSTTSHANTGWTYPSTGRSFPATMLISAAPPMRWRPPTPAPSASSD